MILILDFMRVRLAQIKCSSLNFLEKGCCEYSEPMFGYSTVSNNSLIEIKTLK